MPPIVTTAEIDRPAAEVFASPPTRPGSASGRRAWLTGTWTARDGSTQPPVGAKCV